MIHYSIYFYQTSWIWSRKRTLYHYVSAGMPLNFDIYQVPMPSAYFLSLLTNYWNLYWSLKKTLFHLGGSSQIEDGEFSLKLVDFLLQFDKMNHQHSVFFLQCELTQNGTYKWNIFHIFFGCADNICLVIFLPHWSLRFRNQISYNHYIIFSKYFLNCIFQIIQISIFFVVSHIELNYFISHTNWKIFFWFFIFLGIKYRCLTQIRNKCSIWRILTLSVFWVGW